MTASYRTTLKSDVVYLAENLRKADKEELYASMGKPPLEALLWSWEVSDECNTIIMPDGEVGGIFGTSNPYRNVGCPWMMATDRLPEITTKFLRVSRQWVERQNQIYPLLMNYVDERNEVAIKWLRFLGFTFIQRVENFGYAKVPFYEFVRIPNV